MTTCLIVDDSSVVRKISRRILEEFKFECSEAADGQIAVDHCLKQMPDLVLLDWNMPVMNGPEFLRNLRRMPNGATPKVVFCTTENEMSAIMQAMSEGADEFIMKPFDRDILHDKLLQIGMLDD